MRALRAASVTAVAAAIAACGTRRVQPSPTPSPLPTAVLQQRYLAAADAYDAAEAPILRLEQASCVAAGGDLNACETALSNDRQQTISFDNAVRVLRLPSGVARTKLTNAWFDSKLMVTSTLRNWRTVLKLGELVARAGSAGQ